MKKILLILVAVLITATIQAQRGFNYKAVLTDSGSILANTNVDVQITLIKDDGVSPIYQETHMTMTDDNGIFIIIIGEGNTVDGIFNTINWQNDYYLKVEVDTGSGYTDFGTTPFKSVPYAKYAENGDGAKEIDDLSDAIYDDSSLFLGNGAGILDEGDRENVGVGKETLHSNTSGYGNAANGYQAMYSNNSGFFNVAVGHSALYSNETGTVNTAIGTGALYTNNDGGGNTAIGQASLYNANASYNTAVGYATLRANTTGFDNVAIGSEAMYENIDGGFNTAIGFASLHENTSGSNNTSLGLGSLSSNETGDNNVAIGNEAMLANRLGANNTAIGNGAGFSSTGNNNVFIGYNAGGNETGDNKLYIANSDTASPLIGGDFDANEVVINGKLGVGVASPDELLHIKGTMYETLKVESTANNGFSSLLLKTEPAVNNYLRIIKRGSASGGSMAGISLANMSTIQAGTSAGAMMLAVSSNNPMYFVTNGNQQMTLEADGDLQVKNKITAPYSGDADMKAYIYGSTSNDAGDIDVDRSSSGFSIERQAAGEYRIIFQNPTPGHTYNVMANAITSSSPRIVTVTKNSNLISIYIWDLMGNKIDDKFNFVVFKK